MKKLQNPIAKQIMRNWQMYLLVLPALVFVFVFSYGPMYGFQIAFKNFTAGKGIWGSAWVGFSHFARFFKSPYFSQLIVNTLRISLYDLLLGFPPSHCSGPVLKRDAQWAFQKSLSDNHLCPPFHFRRGALRNGNHFFKSFHRYHQPDYSNAGRRAGGFFKQSRVFPHGHIYCLPNVSAPITYVTSFWYNGDWLKNMNITEEQLPDTLDGYYELMKRFQTEDPNGNGIADEQPMCFASTGEAADVNVYILPAFGIANARFYTEDGEIKFGMLHPNWVEFVKYVNKLYDEKKSTTTGIPWRPPPGWPRAIPT